MALINWFNSCQETSKLRRPSKCNIDTNIQNMIDFFTSTHYDINCEADSTRCNKQYVPRKSPIDERLHLQCKMGIDNSANMGCDGMQFIEPRGSFKIPKSPIPMPMGMPPTPPPCHGGNDVNYSFDPEIQLKEEANLDSKYLSTCKAPYLWNGMLPNRSNRITTYSPKVFIGGIPWDMSEQSLNKLFEPFGRIRVEWPRRDKHAIQPKGYAYVIFEAETKVRELLASCTTSNSCSSNSGNYYFHISSGRIRAKQVEIIPWTISDSNFVTATHQKLNPSKTVFVGALHGKLTAEGLAKIMNDMFDGVIYAGIDTDKYKYPIGSGRVTFNNSRSYMKAVSAGFIKIKTSLFTKTIQVDPYLEDTLCALCGVQHGPYFCRELACFRYFCRTCWQWQHSFYDFKLHKPLTRSSRSDTLIGFDVGSP